jgi:hypothetical protein
MRSGRVLVVACVAVLAASCGTERAQSSGVAAAAAHTADLSARLAETTTVQKQGHSVTFAETGVYDFAHSRGRLRIQELGLTTEVVFLPGGTYWRFPGDAAGQLPPEKSWIVIPSADSGGLGGTLPGVLGPFSGADPADLLSALTAASSSVTKLGAATIRGVQVRGYRVRMDLARVASRVPRGQRADWRAFAQSLGAATIPLDIWVDQRNLVRRVRISLHRPSVPGSRAVSGLTQTLDFWDFGVPVRVSAPPAAEVVSMS